MMTSRKCSLHLLAALLAGTVGLGGIDSVVAKDNDIWKVEGKLLGKPLRNASHPDDSNSRKSEDVSGIACAASSGFPRLCVVADDETQGAQIVILKEGELIAGSFIRLINDVYDEKPVELDAEGVAYADGSFYVIGSHGRARHESTAADLAKSDAKAAASRHLFRIRFAPDSVDLRTGTLLAPPMITRSSGLPQLINEQPELKPWFDQPLDRNGLTIEGVAAQAGTLYVGMRAPVMQNGSAVILSLPPGVLFDGQAGQARVHQIMLDKDTRGHARGIRDIVPHRANLLILAGPVTDPPDDNVRAGDYAIYSWNRVDPAAKLLRDLPAYGKAIKPEALLPLDEKDGELRMLVLFDGPKEGAPTPVRVRLR